MVLPRKERKDLMEKPFDLPAFKHEVEDLARTGMLAEFLDELGPVSYGDIDGLKRRYASAIIQLDRMRPQLAIADVLSRSPESGWSIKETLGHLVDTDRDIWWPRIELCLREEQPPFEDIDQKNLIVAHDWQAQPLEGILVQFVRSRWVCSMKLHSLSREQFERTGVHDVLGEVSILRIAQILVAHDEHYLGKIRAVLNGSRS